MSPLYKDLASLALRSGLSRSIAPIVVQSMASIVMCEFTNLLSQRDGATLLELTTSKLKNRLASGRWDDCVDNPLGGSFFLMKQRSMNNTHP